jgi:lipid-A-disaccharide synthase
MKLYIIAGERSGDLHGGNLIIALRSRREGIFCRGFGGDHMMQAGMDVVTHYREMAFMGFAEVLANLGTISKKLKHCKQDILDFKPDAVILIDYAGFNLRIARFARQQGIKVYWYIAPKVWAWNQKRAWKLKACIDRMLVILPFEKDFFKKFDWEVDYVGNPVLDAVKKHVPERDFLQRNNLAPDRPIVALLPGSRKQEVKLIIPVMAEVVKKFPEIQFAVAAVDNLPQTYYQPLRVMSNVKFVTGATYDLLSHSRAAIVTSGTATLETALFKVPQVVVYKTSSVSYVIAKNLIRVPYISLVNLVGNREIVKELIQSRAGVSEISEEVERLLNNQNYRASLLTGYDEIIKLLDIGSASDNAADLMLRYLKE